MTTAVLPVLMAVTVVVAVTVTVLVTVPLAESVRAHLRQHPVLQGSDALFHGGLLDTSGL